MKVLVILAVCLALSHGSSLKKRAHMSSDPPPTVLDYSSPAYDIASPPPPPPDCGPRELTPRAFKKRIEGMVGRMKNVEMHVDSMITEAEDYVADPDGKAFESLGGPYSTLMHEAESMFNDVASGLVDLGRELYEGGDGFRADDLWCGNFQNIVIDAANPDMRQHLVSDFVVDLECFQGVLSGVDQIPLDHLDSMSENDAIGLVAEFLKRLTMAKRNAHRFAEAAEKAVMELLASEGDSANGDPTVRTLRAFVRMLKKRGLIN